MRWEGDRRETRGRGVQGKRGDYYYYIIIIIFFRWTPTKIEGTN